MPPFQYDTDFYNICGGSDIYMVLKWFLMMLDLLSRKPLWTWGLQSGFPFERQRFRVSTQWLCVCCLAGPARGEPLKNMGLWQLISSSFLMCIYPHSGSVYPYNGCLCYEVVEGVTPDNHGALKVVFQYSSSYHRGLDPHSGSVCPHSGCLYCEGRGVGGPW